MVLLENDSFLTELTRLFQKCRSTGSVVITLKKYDGRTKPVPRKGNPETYDPADNKCLIRASDGKKRISTVSSAASAPRDTPPGDVNEGRADIKQTASTISSTVVEPTQGKLRKYHLQSALLSISTKEVIKFQMAYSNLLRAHMDGLKKKDKKSKSKKTKATQ